MDLDKQLEWAKTEAERIKGVALHWRTDASYVTDEQREMLCGPAVEFLRKIAPDSQFAASALAVLDRSNVRYHNEQAAGFAIAAQLEGWVESVKAGFAAFLPYEARSRIDAATDLMEQVQALLDETGVHSAAPVMLAGAALEEFLRSLLATTTATVVGKPSLTTYADALRRAGKLSANDVKDVIAMAGTRNDAAHGHFDLISTARAQLMADHVNLFIRQHTE